MQPICTIIHHFVVYMILTRHTIAVSRRDAWSAGRLPGLRIQDGGLTRDRSSTSTFKMAVEGKTHVIDISLTGSSVNEKQAIAMDGGEESGSMCLNFGY